MSLLYGYLTKSEALICVDSRMCTIGKEPKITSDTVAKLFQCGNTLIFCNGHYATLMNVLNELNAKFGGKDLPLSEVRAILKKHHEKLLHGIEEAGLHEEFTDKDGKVKTIGLGIITLTDDLRPISYYLTSHDDFRPQVTYCKADEEGVNLMLGVVEGDFEPDAFTWGRDNELRFNDRVEYIRALYAHCNDEQIGGYLTGYHLGKDGVLLVLHEPIPDRKAHRYLDGRLTMGSGVTMEWSSILNKPSIPSLPGYIQSTYIDASSVSSFHIAGNRVEARTPTSNSTNSSDYGFHLTRVNSDNTLSRFLSIYSYIGGITGVQPFTVLSTKPLATELFFDTPRTTFSGSVGFTGGGTLDLSQLGGITWGTHAPTAKWA